MSHCISNVTTDSRLLAPAAGFQRNPPKAGDLFPTNGIVIAPPLFFSKQNPNRQPISRRRLAEGSNSALSQ